MCVCVHIHTYMYVYVMPIKQEILGQSIFVCSKGHGDYSQEPVSQNSWEMAAANTLLG